MKRRDAVNHRPPGERSRARAHAAIHDSVRCPYFGALIDSASCKVYMDEREQPSICSSTSFSCSRCKDLDWSLHQTRSKGGHLTSEERTPNGTRNRRIDLAATLLRASKYGSRPFAASLCLPHAEPTESHQSSAMLKRLPQLNPCYTALSYLDSCYARYQGHWLSPSPRYAK